MRSIRIKYTLLTICAIIVALSIATMIGVESIKRLGNDDAEQMLSLMCSTGAMNLESYFTSVERSAQTVASLVQNSLEDMPLDQLGNQVEKARSLFGEVAYHTNGVLTYYFRIDPALSGEVKGFWYVNQDGNGFREHEVTDITQYDTSDTSRLVWFTVPKATGKGVWLPPYSTENLDVLVISYNLPVYWNDRFVGVIGIEIDCETLDRVVENIRLFDSGYAFLMDADSHMIYHPAIRSGQKVFSVPEGLISENTPVQYRFQGIDKKAAWLPLSNGMKLYVAVPMTEINKSWQKTAWMMFFAALVILALASLIISRFTSRLTKPLRDLSDAARQANRENRELGAEYGGKDEIGILRSSLAHLDYKASHDELTGVFNRAGYELLLSGIDSESTYMIMLDVDNFKTINDTCGHETGDRVLVRLARVLKKHFRSGDYICRIGGDEFVVFMVNTTKEQHDLVAAKIEEISRELFESKDGLPAVTISAGIVHGSECPDAAAWFEEADEAMYRAKQRGKQSSIFFST
ncbi:MAG: diguanylate cyclase [Clostridia bacterium]|nr:diguanylate cyclase [Clostridia bacterium]